MESFIQALWHEAPDVNALAADALTHVIEGRISPAELSATLHVCLTLYPGKKRVILDVLQAFIARGGLTPKRATVPPPPPPAQPAGPAGPKTNVFGSELDDEDQPPTPPPTEVAEDKVVERSEDEDTVVIASSSITIDPMHVPLVQSVVVEFLRNTNHTSNVDLRKDIIQVATSSLLLADTAATQQQLPGGIADVLLARWKPRKNTLLFKSILPRLAQQMPCTALRIGEVIQEFLTTSRSWRCDNTGDAEAKQKQQREIQVFRRELLNILSASRIHHQLFVYIVLRSMLAFHHQSSGSGAAQSSSLGYFSQPLARLFDGETKVLLSPTLQDMVIHSFGIDGDEAQNGSGGGGGVNAGRIAALLYAHELLPLKPALALYFGNLLYSTKPAVEGAHAQTATFEGCLERAAKFFTEMEQYVAGTQYETVLDMATSSTGGGASSSRFQRTAAATDATTSSDGIPKNGEIVPTQYFRVEHKATLPSWSTLLSTHPEQRMAIPWRTFTLSMLEEFLAFELFHVAAEYIRELREVFQIDVFGYRGNGVEQKTAANRVTQRIESYLTPPAAAGGSFNTPGELAVRIERVLPLLVECQARIGSSIKFTWFVCDAALQAWGELPSLAAEYVPIQIAMVTKFLIPSLRGAPPSPPLFTILNQLLEIIPDNDLVNMRVAEVVRGVPRSPYDALRFKELEASFNRNIRRMTLDKVHEYHTATFPVLLSNPMFVIEKLFQQSIGYENAQATIHAQLLSTASPAILKLFLVHGLSLMRTFAAEEREGAENRVSLIANFLCIVWRVTLKTFDGAFALRQVEVALRRPARESLVFSNEFLKACILQLTSAVCEHEEQYNSDQLNALGCFGNVTTWYGRGACASYLGRWHPRDFNPARLEEARAVLAAALNQRLHNPKLSISGSEEGVEESIGHAILVHLATLDSSVYDILGDISGTMESVLLECAKHHNVMNDVMFALAAMVTAIPSIDDVGGVALHHTALKFESIAARRQWLSAASLPTPEPSAIASPTAPTGAAGEEAVPAAAATTTATWAVNTTQLQNIIASSKKLILSTSETHDNEEGSTTSLANEEERFLRVQCTLALLQPYHFSYNEDVYARSKKESDRLVAQLDKELANPANKSSRSSLNASRDWALKQLRLIEVENTTHAQVARDSTQWVDHFLRNEVLPVVTEDPVRFAQQCVVARAALGLEDTLVVSSMLQRLLTISRGQSTAGTTSGCEEETNDAATRKSSVVVVDLLLSVVTLVISTFVSWTDGECKRLGSLLHNILELLDHEVADTRRQQATAVSGTPAGGPSGSPSEGGPIEVVNTKSSLLQLASNFSSKCRAATSSSWSPAFVFDCDAYLAQSFYQILSTPLKSSPNFCFRNAFILLDRIKSRFPRTPQTAAVMMAAVRNHNDKSSAYFAAATAQLKHYLSILSPAAAASSSSPSGANLNAPAAVGAGTSSGAAGSASYMRALLDSLNEAIARETEEAAAIAQTLTRAEDEERKQAAAAAAAVTAATTNNGGEDDDDDESAGLRRRLHEDDAAATADEIADAVGEVAAEESDHESEHNASNDDVDDDGRSSSGSNDNDAAGDSQRSQSDDDDDHMDGAADNNDDSSRKRPREENIPSE